jgi:hypothetical protein
LGVYLFPFTSATKLHFFLGAFLHFITGADTGKLISLRTVREELGNPNQRAVPKEDWIVVENAFEPIIDKDTFSEDSMAPRSKGAGAVPCLTAKAQASPDPTFQTVVQPENCLWRLRPGTDAAESPTDLLSVCGKA